MMREPETLVTILFEVATEKRFINQEPVLVMRATNGTRLQFDAYEFLVTMGYDPQKFRNGDEVEITFRLKSRLVTRREEV